MLTDEAISRGCGEMAARRYDLAERELLSRTQREVREDLELFEVRERNRVVVEHTLQRPRVTLISQHTGFAGTVLTGAGRMAGAGAGGSGGAFAVYYSATELRDVQIVVKVMSATSRSMQVTGIPKGKRKPRRFSAVATELHAPRSLVLEGWGLPAPPNPQRVGKRDDSNPDQIGFTVSSATWNRRREELFDQYVEMVRERLIIDFPYGVGTEESR